MSVDLQKCEVGRVVAADDPCRIFLAVIGGDGDGIDRSGPGEALDQVVVGNDIAIGRDDKARSQRARLASPLLLLLLLLLLTLVRSSALAVLLRLRIRVELPEELLERVVLRGAHGHPLLGGDIDHRRLKPGDEVRKGHRRTGSWSKHRCARRVLRDLCASLPSGKRECRSPEQQGHCDPVGVAHFSGLLRAHRYSIIWCETQGR